MNKKITDAITSPFVEWKTWIFVALPTFLLLLYWCFQHTAIGFLQLHSLDEYVFHGSLRYMLESLVSGNYSGLFGYGFYQYGFAYFFLNLVIAAPFILTEHTALAIATPRVITTLFATGSLIFIYQYTRHYVTPAIALLFTAIFITLPAFWYNATWFHPDWPMTFWLLGCVYFFTKDRFAYQENFWLGVICYSLAVAFKYQAITFLPLLILYYFYDEVRLLKVISAVKRLPRFLVTLTTIVGVFTALNPYIIHPLGWKAFTGAFMTNMESNATNHGAAAIVSLTDKIHFAIGDYYLNIIFLLVLVLASLWLLWLYIKRSERDLNTIIAITFLINFCYLLFFVNKAWQIYYLPVIVIGLLSLIHFVKDVSLSHQKILLTFVCFAQVLVYGTTFPAVLTTSRDATTPDFNTYTPSENVAIDTFITASLTGRVNDKTSIIITPFTPLSFETLGLRYEQVKIIFSALDRSSIDEAFYIEGQKKYWGHLKSDEELRHSFSKANLIILRKDIPYITTARIDQLQNKSAYEEAVRILSELYSGELNYTVLAENDKVVIFTTR